MSENIKKQSSQSFRSLKLMDNRIEQNYNGFWAGTNEVIPLTKIDSVYYGYKKRVRLFVLGVILFIAGLILSTINNRGYRLIANISSGNYSLIVLLVIIFGIVLVVLGLIFKHEVVTFRAGTTSVSETGNGSIGFAKQVLSRVK